MNQSGFTSFYTEMIQTIISNGSIDSDGILNLLNQFMPEEYISVYGRCRIQSSPPISVGYLTPSPGALRSMFLFYIAKGSYVEIRNDWDWGIGEYNVLIDGEKIAEKECVVFGFYGFTRDWSDRRGLYHYFTIDGKALLAFHGF